MVAWQLQPTPEQPSGWAVHGCRGCGGVWVGSTTLDAMIEGAQQRGTEGRAPQVVRRELSLGGKVVYRPCSVCGETMSRRNFARISGVIVDQCRNHGSFFDAGELEDVLAFVRSGGLLLSRRRENEELARERRQAEFRAMPRSPLMQQVEPMSGLPVGEFSEPGLGVGLDLAFVRWAGRWVRNMFR